MFNLEQNHEVFSLEIITFPTKSQKFPIGQVFLQKMRSLTQDMTRPAATSIQQLTPTKDQQAESNYSPTPKTNPKMNKQLKFISCLTKEWVSLQ